MNSLLRVKRDNVIEYNRDDKRFLFIFLVFFFSYVDLQLFPWNRPPNCLWFSCLYSHSIEVRSYGFMNELFMNEPLIW